LARSFSRHGRDDDSLTPPPLPLTGIYDGISLYYTGGTGGTLRKFTLTGLPTAPTNPSDNLGIVVQSVGLPKYAAPHPTIADLETLNTNVHSVSRISKVSCRECDHLGTQLTAAARRSLDGVGHRDVGAAFLHQRDRGVRRSIGARHLTTQFLR